MASHLDFRPAVLNGVHGYDVGPVGQPEVTKGFVYDSGGTDQWCATWGEGRWVPGFATRGHAGAFITNWRFTLDRGLAE